MYNGVCKMGKNKYLVLLVAILFILAVFGVVSGYDSSVRASQTPIVALLQIDGETVTQLPLKDYPKLHEIDLSEYGIDGSINIRNDGASITKMDCPDHICVDTGWISTVTESAVCLPNKVYLTLV